MATTEAQRKSMYERASKVAKELKTTRAAPEPKAEEAAVLVATEMKAGQGREVPSNAFTRTELAQSAEAELRPVKKPPRWVYAMIERGATRQQVLDRAHERLKRSPTKSNLLLVQALLQEFARAPRSRIKPGELVTRESLSEFIVKEG